ncbi:hypothetical protein PANDA_008387 [Ailuropoda melanoleuca]|uniref:Triadin n=1 Tax=Ailuropoda melanoleuca TaxID=9646 RepID=D2HCQ1_AILME|nr:hypothetical protein PANDA_008387 [Ailuropoda melanoleuca]
MPKSPGKVLKRTVTEDIVTTFSSPAAWLLVIALIITWSAVAVVMFDLVDYKNFSASSISKIGSDPLKLVHDAVEETTDWVYGFFSLLSDIISSEGDEEDDDDGDEDTDKGWTSVSFNSSHNLELIPSDKMLLRTKELELRGARVAPAAAASVRFLVCKLPLALQQTQPWTNMVAQREKEKVKVKEKEKSEKKEERKAKAEEKIKKEVKGGKQEKVKPTAAKVKEVQKTPPKPKEKEGKETAAVSKHEQKGSRVLVLETLAIT